MTNKIHIVSTVSVYHGIENKAFTDLEEANKYYHSTVENLNKDTCTVYMRENVEIK